MTLLPTIRPIPSRHGRVRPALALLLLALLLAPILFLRFTSGREPARQAPSAAAVTAPTSDAARPMVPDLPEAAVPARSSVAESPGSDAIAAAPSSETEAPAPPLDLTIVWDDATAVVDATVAITSGEEVLEHGQTQADGRLQLEPVSATDAEVFVVQGAVLVARVPLSAPSGAVRVEVPLLRSVSGVVRVDGALPARPVHLQLETEGTQGGPRLAPPFVQRILVGGSRSDAYARTRTDEEGRFTFGGLTPDWSGELVPTWPLQLLSGEDSLRLNAPVQGLQVDLVAPVSLRGRVLSPSGEPVPNCQVRVHVQHDQGTSTSFLRTGEDGRFLYPLRGDHPSSAELDFRAGDIGIAKASTPLDPDAGTDIGDVRLVPGREFYFRVGNADGTPITGAIVSYPGGTSEPSDTDGICVLKNLSAEAVSVSAYALSYRSELVEVPASASGDAPGGSALSPIEVTLHRTAALRFAFLTPEGTPAPGVVMVLEGTNVFDTESGGPAWKQASLGASSISVSEVTWKSNGERTASGTFSAGTSGRLFLTGLSSGVPILATARDSAGADLGWSETIVLDPEEVREIEVPIRRAVTTLRGHVRAEDGSPIANAVVSFPESQVQQLRTDSEGAFQLGPIYVESLNLLVTSPDYAAQILYAVPTRQPVEVVLQRGRTVVLTVLDSAGTRHRAEHVDATLDGISVGQGVGQEDGSARFEHLPFGPVEIQAIVNGAWFSTAVEDGPETTIVIPEPGSLTVLWGRGLPSTSSLTARIMETSDTFPEQEHLFTAEDLVAGRFTFSSVFPGTYFVGWVLGSEEGDVKLAASAEVEIHPGEAAVVSPQEPR